jgi:1-aminocyclopropane-1-carboxylate deaminase
MDIIDERLAVIQPLSKFWYQNKVIAMDMLRLDLLHPVVSGNKWFKLRLNMAHAVDHGFKAIVTFGGGFSNHLIATAFTAKKFGLPSYGIVRGRYAALTPTLQACVDAGMQLVFVTKEDYGNKEDMTWIKTLVDHFDEIFIIPEGGANEWGRAGAGLLNRFVANDYTHIMVAVGTGTTLTGLRNKLPAHQQIMGFVPMKGGNYLETCVRSHLQPEKDSNWLLTDQYHFGGFGKWNSELLRFMNDFYRDNHIPLDVVYTSKMMYGLNQMLADNYFSTCDKILCIHSGGLQGNLSVKGELVY